MFFIFIFFLLFLYLTLCNFHLLTSASQYIFRVLRGSNDVHIILLINVNYTRIKFYVISSIPMFNVRDLQQALQSSSLFILFRNNKKWREKRTKKNVETEKKKKKIECNVLSQSFAIQIVSRISANSNW